MYADGEQILEECLSEEDYKAQFTLQKCEKMELPYNYFLYSTGRRGYYKLHVPSELVNASHDIRLEFAFDGLNLQVFSGRTLINDYFNIDRKFVMHLRDYKKYLQADPVLVIRTAPKTKFGISNVYNEVAVPLYSNHLALTSARPVLIKQVDPASCEASENF